MRFKEVINRIKKVEIQGADAIAIAGVKALSLKGANVKKLLNSRPTEPALKNAVKFAKKYGQEAALEYFKEAREKIVRYGVKKVKPIVFTHCHSSTVIDILKSAHKKGIKFKVYNTETRPLYQGRKTAKELAKVGINVVNVIDAAGGIAMTMDHKKEHVAMFGADAILIENGKVKGIINKIGSGMFAELAYNHKIPLYICTNSWKSSFNKIEIEKRSFEEVWKNAPKKIKIKNPAFEIINPKYVKAIISELGILIPDKFAKKVKRVYKWM